MELVFLIEFIAKILLLFLTGKYRTEADFEQTARVGGIKKYFNVEGKAVLAALDKLSAKYQSQPATLVLAGLLVNALIKAPIVSATSENQLQTIFNAPQLKLDAENIEIIYQAGK